MLEEAGGGVEKVCENREGDVVESKPDGELLTWLTGDDVVDDGGGINAMVVRSQGWNWRVTRFTRRPMGLYGAVNGRIKLCEK